MNDLYLNQVSTRYSFLPNFTVDTNTACTELGVATIYHTTGTSAGTVNYLTRQVSQLAAFEQRTGTLSGIEATRPVRAAGSAAPRQHHAMYVAKGQSVATVLR